MIKTDREAELPMEMKEEMAADMYSEVVDRLSVEVKSLKRTELRLTPKTEELQRDG